MGIGTPVLWTIVGILLTIATLLATTVYRVGHTFGGMNARIDELERWRKSIREDMHEISDRLEDQTKELGRLATLIEERTDRRTIQRSGG